MKKNSTSIDTFTGVAVDAGLRLVREAIWDGKSCNWIGASIAEVAGRHQVTRSGCSSGIYSGIGGIAIFLARLTEEVNEPLINLTFNGAMSTLTEVMTPHENLNYSWFSGNLGIADLLITVGELKRKPKWTRAGWKLLADVCAKEPTGDEIDIISGVAGAIPVLLRHHRARKEEWLLGAALKCGRLLLSKAVKSNRHYYWNTLPGSGGLTGYSHGSAGIALALLELYNATGNREWLDAGMMGFNFERVNFNTNLNNWTDLRQMPGSPANGYSCAEAWCHGAPGIALSRLRAWQITGDASFMNEARTALQTTLLGIHRSQTNYSLCHGIAGNADVLFTAGIIMNDAHLIQAATEAGHLGIERIVNNNLSWLSGVSDPMGSNTTYENPSLMLGLAGTGYFYLRLGNPTKVPSLLLVC